MAGQGTRGGRQGSRADARPTTGRERLWRVSSAFRGTPGQLRGLTRALRNLRQRLSRPTFSSSMARRSYGAKPETSRMSSRTKAVRLVSLPCGERRRAWQPRIRQQASATSRPRQWAGKEAARASRNAAGQRRGRSSAGARWPAGGASGRAYLGVDRLGDLLLLGRDETLVQAEGNPRLSHNVCEAGRKGRGSRGPRRGFRPRRISNWARFILHSAPIFP